MDKIEQRVKKFVYVLMIVSILSTLGMMFVAETFVLDNVKDEVLQNAEKEVLNIEKNINMCLRDSIHRLRTISDSKRLRTFITVPENKRNTRDLQHAFQFVLKSQKNIFQVRYIDKFGEEKIKYEKKNGVIIKVPKSKLQDKSSRHYFNDARDHTTPFFTTIGLTMEYGILEIPYVPVFRTVIPIRIEGKFEGILVANHYAQSFINKVINSELYDISLYNKDAYIVYDYNGEQQQGIVFNNEKSLFDRYFDYKKMLQTTMYNNGESVSKLLKFDYPFIGGIGVLLRSNAQYNKHLEQFAARIYLIHFIILLVLSIIPIILIKHYINDSKEFDELQSYAKWLENKNSKLSNDTLTDSLTGVGNRKKCENSLETLFESYDRYDNIFSTVIIELKDFNSINCEYGYDVGDEVIKFLADSINEYMRKSDHFIRYGDETFIVFLPNTKEHNANKFANKIKEFVDNLEFRYDDDNIIGLSVNVDVDTIVENDTAQTVLKRIVKSIHTSEKSNRQRTCSIESCGCKI
jgi:diguanylate cyclase (GGDEF)-like protein